MKLTKISVIIPTYNREQILINTIKDVLLQNYDDFEIIIIDQTKIHELETEEFLTSLAAESKIRWYQVAWKSLPRARNYGVEQAQGEIIVFIDDDVQIPRDYLQNHLTNYQQNSLIGAVAGRIFDRMKLSESCQLNQHNSLYSIDYLPLEAMNPAIAWYYLDLVHTTKPQQVISARGCNMSFRREIFTKYNLFFDERFRGSAVREESDFCLRLRTTGYQIWYAPDAYLIHLGEMTGGCHEISTRSLEYQFTFYHNHFLMALKNLTFSQQLAFYLKLFDCHVLGHPPCYKSGSLLKIIIRFSFYLLGFINALLSLFQPLKKNPENCCL